MTDERRRDRNTRADGRVLDLGCGTGLEIDTILERAPNAQITGYDVSEQMPGRLRSKYRAMLSQIRLISESFLNAFFERHAYDHVVSVLNLHRLLPEKKGEFYGRKVDRSAERRKSKWNP